MTKFENLDAGYRRLLEAEEALLRAGEANLAQAAYAVAAGVMAETRATIEAASDDSSDTGEGTSF